MAAVPKPTKSVSPLSYARSPLEEADVILGHIDQVDNGNLGLVELAEACAELREAVALYGLPNLPPIVTAAWHDMDDAVSAIYGPLPANLGIHRVRRTA